MSVQQFPESAIRSFQSLAKTDLSLFTRWMFLQRRGYQWLMSPHHKIICDALTRVFTGECKRLIINIPPRYSKTEIAVINFMAWALGQCPDAEFIHTSYSGRLAANNAWQARELVQSEQYRHIFPETQLRNDSSARDEWRTTAGGCVYAVGAGGTITGYGAGKHRPGFGGCFPYDEIVETEIGPLKIGDIVTKRIPVMVWSFNFDSRKTELKPVDTFWTNPPSEILEVVLSDGGTFRCTPDHKIYTSEGWVKAKDLSGGHVLPLPLTGVFDLVDADPCLFRDIFPASGPVEDNGKLGFGKLGLVIPRRIREMFGDSLPCLPRLDLPDNASSYPVLSGKRRRAILALENVNNVQPGELGTRPFFKNGECSVFDSILHVFGLRSVCEVFKPVVGAVSVKMSALKLWWSRANESRKNRLVDKLSGHLASDGAIHPVVPFSVGAIFEDFSRELIRGPFSVDFPGDTAGPPLVADFVKSKKSRYRFPVLVRSVGHVDSSYCLEVRSNNNFYVSQSQVLVSNCILIDDPHKADEARSDVMRNNVLEWFQNTLESRKNSPDTPIILIMQRLHEEDLAGWLLAGGNGEEWEHICLSALQEDGTALWPAKHSVDDLLRMQTASPYNFSGQYQQRPSPAEGGIFKPDQIQVVDAIPAGNIKWVRGWDLASTTDGDWTAGLRLGKLADGRFIVADICRVRVGPDQRDAAIQNTAALDGRSTKISLPQDPGQAGKTQVLYLSRALAGYSVTSSPESGDKVTRAEPAAAQVNVGNVMMLRGDWNNQFIQELRMFPNGTFDDQVDAFSRAFMELIGARKGFFTR